MFINIAIMEPCIAFVNNSAGIVKIAKVYYPSKTVPKSIVSYSYKKSWIDLTSAVYSVENK